MSRCTALNPKWFVEQSGKTGRSKDGDKHSFQCSIPKEYREERVRFDAFIQCSTDTIKVCRVLLQTTGTTRENGTTHFRAVAALRFLFSHFRLSFFIENGEIASKRSYFMTSECYVALLFLLSDLLSKVLTLKKQRRRQTFAPNLDTQRI